MFDLGKILGWFRKNITGKDFLLILVIVAVYFIMRLVYLDRFPIFTDEGIYINWARIAWKDANWRFISLTDGRQPLQTWATIPFLKLFPNDPLFAGRLFPVTSGFIALSGVFVLLFYLFGKKAAYWGSFFYLLTPYFLFYDRLAIVDSSVNAGFIWILFFSILLARTLRLDVALIFGLTAGMTSLAKSSAQMLIGVTAISPLLFLEKNLKRFLGKVINFLPLFAIVVFLTLILYNVQRLSPFLHFVAEKNKTFVMTFPEFLKTPFAVFFHNIQIIPQYVFWEAAFILPLIGILGLYLLFKKDVKLFFYLILWILLPFLAISFFAKVVFPRYLNFFATLFLIPASYFVVAEKNKRLILAALVLYILSIFYFDYAILFDQKNIPFPEIDRGQYIEGTSAGGGVKEIIEFSREKAKEKPVVLLAEGNFGVVGDMLNASLKPGDNISVRGYWPLDEKNLIENQKEIGKNQVFIVFSHRTQFPSNWPIRFIKKYDKGQSAFYLFQLQK